MEKPIRVTESMAALLRTEVEVFQANNNGHVSTEDVAGMRRMAQMDADMSEKIQELEGTVKLAELLRVDLV